MSVSGRNIISTPDAPRPVGPYSQAVIVNDTMYLAGQIGLDPKLAQWYQVVQLQRQNRLCRTWGQYSMQLGYHSVMVTVLLANIADFESMNEVYKKYFLSHFPARSAFQVGALPKGANIEIEAIATVGKIADLNGETA